MNYNMEKFRNDIIDVINNSHLPIGAAYYILKDCFNELASAYNNAIKEELNNSNDETEVINIAHFDKPEKNKKQKTQPVPASPTKEDK